MTAAAAAAVTPTAWWVLGAVGSLACALIWACRPRSTAVTVWLAVAAYAALLAAFFYGANVGLDTLHGATRHGAWVAERLGGLELWFVLCPGVTAVALATALRNAWVRKVKPYPAAALAEAQKAGKPIALHFRADWCPTCRLQDRALESLKAEPGLDLTVLSVNYDTEKDLKAQYNVRGQSTPVVLKGQKEQARSVADTTADGLRSALKTAL